jgi:hypothetical protein
MLVHGQDLEYFRALAQEELFEQRTTRHPRHC